MYNRLIIYPENQTLNSEPRFKISKIYIGSRKVDYERIRDNKGIKQYSVHWSDLELNEEEMNDDNSVKKLGLKRQRENYGYFVLKSNDLELTLNTWFEKLGRIRSNGSL